MREERWDNAEQWLRRVPEGIVRDFGGGRADLADPGSPDPLIAVRDLRRLDHSDHRARTVSERSTALFRYGSYYYTHVTQLLYNAALWHGDRAPPRSRR